MNIQPIKMDKYNARAAQREYAKSVRRHRAERLAQADTDLARARLKKSAIELEDEALQRAYGALGRGKQVINLAAVMRAAGLDDATKLPRLAIARGTCSVSVCVSARLLQRFDRMALHWKTRTPWSRLRCLAPSSRMRRGVPLKIYQRSGASSRCAHKFRRVIAQSRTKRGSSTFCGNRSGSSARRIQIHF